MPSTLADTSLASPPENACQGINQPKEIDELARVEGLPRYRWNRSEYHAMGEAGIFGPWQRVELVEGEVIAVSPKSVPHTLATSKILKRISKIFKRRNYTVRKEDPVVLDDGSEPEPDVVVARGPELVYHQRHPGPEDIALIIEVSQATLYADRIQKGRVYARAGIPEYWLLNLRERRLEVYRQPESINGEYGYRTVLQFSEEDTVSALEEPDAVMAVRDLMP